MALGPGGQIALQGGVDIAGGIMGNLFQKRNIRLQKEANIEMADYAYNKDEQMWHTQNLYNSPKEQMARFKQAGLNPNLIYGRGTPGNAVSMPKRQQVTAGLRQTKVPTPNVLGMYNNQRQVESSLKNQDADTLYKENLAQTQDTITTMKMIDNELKNAQLAYWQGASFVKRDGGRGLNIDKHSFGPLFKSMGRSNDAKLYVNNLTIKKQALLDAQIGLTLQNLKTKQRQYSWMPWEKGIGLGTKVGATVIGGRVGGKFLKSVGSPKLKPIKKNWKLSPNTKF